MFVENVLSAVIAASLNTLKYNRVVIGVNMSATGLSLVLLGILLPFLVTQTSDNLVKVCS